ncbi:unnamed protein product [Penicillium salamii]|uniref:Uncharacterized protein n=1 Tax=Penicillium salamii TaxID=1612424 RepID=A0A9W4IZS3_9EURO|nr:unnamed protein product [Penicillium salamii]CAG8035291.1 unnamed protein product [Penicillium salamii]CAG8056288.1 unnamed protein product [Penicillium salamii]CAG8113245.1 unnamed protein product [Penicillium salamii]CAG8262795.1 unnamed protein product [Penicillium salamii]
MVRSYLLVGILAALSQSAHGAVFNDGIKSKVGDKLLPLLHDAEDPTTVSFAESSSAGEQLWKFDTEGQASPDDAVITPSDSAKTLICREGSHCILDEQQERQVYRVIRVEEKDPIFTFQDLETGLYVSRSDDLHLVLTETKSEKIYFLLDKTVGQHEEV